ncbi:MAG: DMT family transporter [Pseudomonadota bacterium]
MTSHPDDTNRAVVVIVVTVLALSLGDAVIKSTSATFSLWQIFVLRSLLVVPCLLLVIKQSSAVGQWMPLAPWWTIVRSGLLTLMWVSYYFSLAHVELSVAAAAYYTLPLFIMLFASYFLGDTIGVSGWVAILIGFLGVVLILEPRAENFNWYALLPLLSAIFYALAMILTRSRCRGEHVFVLSLWLNLTMLGAGLVATVFLLVVGVSVQHAAAQPFLLAGWSSLGIRELLSLLLLSVAIIIGSVGAAYAYQRGKPATIAVFDFSYVGFAMIWGVLFFSEAPGLRGMAGVLLIVIAGVLAVRQAQE